MVSKSTESWLSFYKDAVATEVHTKDKRYPAFYQKDPSTSSVLGLYENIFNSTLFIITNKIVNILTRGKKPGADTDFFFSKETLISTVNQCAGIILNTARDEESKTSKKSNINESKEVLERNMQKAQAIAVNFFEVSCPKVSFPSDLTREALDIWIENVTIQATNHSYKSLGLTKCEAVEFTQDDFQEFSIDSKEVTAKPKYINCAAFALLCIRELAAKKQIFEMQKDDSFIEHLFTHLNKWGYQPTKDPQPQDLAVYVDDANKPGHVGVVDEHHQIHSKFGIMNPSSHLHKLFDLPVYYGRKVVFFRKTGKAT